jgi:uncharacterized membrane protein
MQGILEIIQHWHVHPIADHFSVAVLIIAVITDLVASLFWTRLWLRYSALALMIIGAAAAWASNVTGEWEAHRVWKTVQGIDGPAFEILRRHAEIGDILPWVFLVLALWRIGVQTLGFIRRFRAIYLLIAVLAAATLGYQAYLGGQLVYTYGVGTALLNPPTASPTPQAETTGPATPIPTVYVPSAAATPMAAAPAATVPAPSEPSMTPSAATAPPTPEVPAASGPSVTPAALPSPASPESTAPVAAPTA